MCFFRCIEFEPSERVREEPPDDRNQQTKKPKLHGACWNSFGFLVFWFFGSLVLWFFGFLVLWFFGFLVFWFFGFLVLWFFGFGGVFLKYDPLHIKTKQPIKQKKQKTKEPKNQKTKEPKNQKTKEPKNQKKQKNKKPKNQRTEKPKKQKTKKPKLFQHSPWSFGFLVFWFRWSGGSSRTRSEGSNSIPLEKHEHAGGSDVLKGAVCHGGGGVTIYIYIYTHTYTHVCMPMYACMHACMHACMQAGRQACIYVNEPTHPHLPPKKRHLRWDRRPQRRCIEGRR